MNEQLQLALTATLGKVTSGVEAGVNFLSSEIPEVIQQLLLWKLLEASLLSTICIVLLIVVVLSIKYCGVGERINPNNRYPGVGNCKTTLTHDDDGDPHPGIIAIGAIWGVAVPILVITTIELIGRALQIWLAPKIYLIEYATSLGK